MTGPLECLEFSRFALICSVVAIRIWGPFWLQRSSGVGEKWSCEVMDFGWKMLVGIELGLFLYAVTGHGRRFAFDTGGDENSGPILSGTAGTGGPARTRASAPLRERSNA